MRITPDADARRVSLNASDLLLPAILALVAITAMVVLRRWRDRACTSDAEPAQPSAPADLLAVARPPLGVERGQREFVLEDASGRHLFAELIESSESVLAPRVDSGGSRRAS